MSFNNIQTKKVKYFIILVLFFCNLNCISFDVNSVSSLAQDKLLSNSFIQIQVTASIDTLDLSKNANDFDQFVLKSVHKHKRKSYLSLIKNYQKLLNLLKKQIIIGDQNLLIKSKIKEKYLRKKRLWQFSILFIIKQSSIFVKQYSRELSKLGVTKIIENPKEFMFNSKIIANNAFYQAKAKLQSVLNKYNQMCIQSVKNIQLSDFNIDDTQLIKLDLSDNEDETTQSSDNEQSSYQEYKSYLFCEERCLPKKNKPKLTVIFKIKRDCDKFQDQNSLFIEESSSDSQFKESESQQFTQSQA